jgi:hypothetical protein
MSKRKGSDIGIARVGDWVMLGRKPIVATALSTLLTPEPAAKSSSRPLHLLLPTSRDFVPWRFSDAGRRSAWWPSCVPASENLHRWRHIDPNVRHATRGAMTKLPLPLARHHWAQTAEQRRLADRFVQDSGGPRRDPRELRVPRDHDNVDA